jgi:hypothetical protein
MFSLIDMLLMIMAEIIKPTNFMICFYALTLLAQDRIAGKKWWLRERCRNMQGFQIIWQYFIIAP